MLHWQKACYIGTKKDGTGQERGMRGMLSLATDNDVQLWAAICDMQTQVAR